MDDVVITGIGAVCGTAADAASLFEQLRSGKSMVREHPVYKHYGFRTAALATVSDEVWAQVKASLGPHPAGWGRATQLGVYAARQALCGSGLAGVARPDMRAGVFVGNNKSTFDESQFASLSGYYDAARQRIDFDAFLDEGLHDVDSFHRKHQDTTALALAADSGWQDCISTHGDACAAGGMAIGAAYRRIRAGDLDVALAGASETMAGFAPLAAFAAVGALAADEVLEPSALSRPFDARRSGFVMGEGAAFLVLESAAHARARGAKVISTLRGFACRLEAHRITSSTETGQEYARCISAALADAGLGPQDIEHVNAHGTSTPANDTSEAMALKHVFGDRVGRLPVTANKSALGHSLACSGAIEAVLSALTLANRTLLPTLNFERPCAASEGLDIVTEARAQAVRTVLSNSFGFGGQNCCLVLEEA